MGTKFFQKKQRLWLIMIGVAVTVLFVSSRFTKKDGTQIYIQTADIQMVALKTNNVNDNATAHQSESYNQKSRVKVGIIIPFMREQSGQSKSSSMELMKKCLISVLDTFENDFDYRIYIGIESGKHAEAMPETAQETADAELTAITDKLKQISDLTVIVELNGETFVEMINMLARRAYNDSMDYLVNVNQETVFVTKLWTSQAIDIIKRQTDQNVGVVKPVTLNGTQNVFSVNLVHRTHLDIFFDYYPSEFQSRWVDDWITDVYKPGRSIPLKTWVVSQEHVNGVSRAESIQTKQRLLLLEPNDKTLIQSYIFPKQLLPYAVSFGLYGDNPRYIDGAISNVKLMPVIYPRWQMWIYYNQSVPYEILQFLKRHHFVRMIDMTSSHWLNPMSWRFFVSSNNEIKRYLIRDIDSRITHRERAAVSEWLTSGRKFHVMRDHPNHSSFTMSGGMWGGIRIPNMEDLVQRHMVNGEYLRDMEFLHKTIWPQINQSVIEHDAYTCAKHGRPFPIPRDGLDYVGRVYQNKSHENMTAKEIKEVVNVKAPKICQYNPIKIIILTQRGYRTLQLLLNTIQVAEYNGQPMHVEIRIMAEDSEDNKQAIYVATAFKFKHGTQMVYLIDTGNRPLDVWTNSWTPKWNDERAIILTDDLELSPHWFHSISTIWTTHGYKFSFASVSLSQRTTYNQENATRNHQMDFLYHMKGPVGFSPTAKHWKKFRTWLDSSNLTLKDLELSQDKDEGVQWQHPWLRWCKMNPNLFNLYIQDKSLVTQHGEP